MLPFQRFLAYVLAGCYNSKIALGFWQCLQDLVFCCQRLLRVVQSQPDEALSLVVFPLEHARHVPIE